MRRAVTESNRPAGGVIPAAFTMKKLIARIGAALAKWENKTDHCFAEMDKIRQAEIIKFINDSTL